MPLLTTPPPPSSPLSTGPTVATIDLGCLAHNVGEVRARIPRGCDIIAVVKADAYGHGAVPISIHLQRLGITRFAVACPAEGAALRTAGITGMILVMGALFPEQIPELLAHRLTPVIHDGAIAREFAKELGAPAAPYPVHLKVDTGMGRLGLSPDDALALLQSPVFKGRLQVEGLMTHLADADGDDAAYTRRQLERFADLLLRARAAGVAIPLAHAANSAAILRHPGACFSAVRPGIMLYGYPPPSAATPTLRPILTLTTRVAQIRRMVGGEGISYNRSYTARPGSRIAVLPIGYADGYSRAFSNRGRVLIHGRSAPIVGRVCMDMTMVEVTAIPEIRAGDPVTLIGGDGEERISADDLAAWQETVAYEVLCGLGPRIRRVYREPAAASDMPRRPR